MKYFIFKHTVLITLLVGLVTSCTTYDEQDATIVAYLKINDLLEKQLSESADMEINSFEEMYGAQFISDFCGLGLNFNSNYDEDIIKSFSQRYIIAKDCFDTVRLEADISAELWNYLTTLYTETVPPKAQNAETGRYYTISELKAKYPDYKDLEIEDFSPMELISTVMNEKLYEFSMIAQGDINLHTLYVYYLTSKNKPDINYAEIIKQSGYTPEQSEVEHLVTVFSSLSTGNQPLYTHDEKGFRSFVTDYYETDMFSGEDADEY